MSSSDTLLDLLSFSTSQKEPVANALFSAASPAMTLARRSSSTAGLTWGYYGGTVSVAGIPTQLPNGTVTLLENTTNYVELSPSGVVVVSSGDFTGGDSMAMYSVVTGTAAVESYLDWRMGGGGGAFSRIATAEALGSIRVGDNLDIDPDTGVLSVLGTLLRVDTAEQGLSSTEKSNGVANLGLTRTAATPLTVTYASTLTLDTSVTRVFDITLTGNLVLSFSGGVDGERIMVRVRQDATGSRLINFGAMVRYGTDFSTYAGTTTPSKLDYLIFAFNAADNKYDFLSYNHGF